MSYFATKRVRLAPNGSHLGLFRSNVSTIWLCEARCVLFEANLTSPIPSVNRFCCEISQIMFVQSLMYWYISTWYVCLSFSFYMFVTVTVLLILFLGASIVCFRGQQIVLWYPDRTSVCTQSWHQRLNDLNVSIALKVLLN